MKKLFRQLPFPSGIPSHGASEPPDSIHEGGEFGYARACLVTVKHKQEYYLPPRRWRRLFDEV